MKKGFFVTLCLVVAFITGSVAQSSAFMLCDNYGKTWNLKATGNTLEGVRDTQNLLGCGDLYVRGAFYSNPTKFVITSMQGNGSCVPVIWDGVWITAGSGTWYNNNGTGTGTFTLTDGACDAVAVNNVDDPAVAK